MKQHKQIKWNIDSHWIQWFQIHTPFGLIALRATVLVIKFVVVIYDRRNIMQNIYTTQYTFVLNEWTNQWFSRYTTQFNFKMEVLNEFYLLVGYITIYIFYKWYLYVVCFWNVVAVAAAFFRIEWCTRDKVTCISWIKPFLFSSIFFHRMRQSIFYSCYMLQLVAIEWISILFIRMQLRLQCVHQKL